MTMSPRVYIALSTFAKQDEEPLNVLKASGLAFDMNHSGRRLSRDEIIRHGRGFEGIVAGLEPYDAAVLEALTGLQCISRCGAGVDNIDLQKAGEKKITVFNTPEVVAQPVAELALAMMLDLLHKVTRHTLLMRAHRWERHTGNLLFGKKAGIIGLGRIGRKLAQMLRGLNIEVLGSDIQPDLAWAQDHGVKIVSLPQLLAESDIISLHLSLSAAHPFCLGAEEIAQMKQGAILINLARGGLVDETALLQALQSGRLAGAGLDVYAQEPYAGPLCGLDNVILTPHAATLTQESRLGMELEAVQNIVRFLKK